MNGLWAVFRHYLWMQQVDSLCGFQELKLGQFSGSVVLLQLAPQLFHLSCQEVVPAFSHGWLLLQFFILVNRLIQLRLKVLLIYSGDQNKRFPKVWGLWSYPNCVFYISWQYILSALTKLLTRCPRAIMFSSWATKNLSTLLLGYLNGRENIAYFNAYIIPIMPNFHAYRL